MTTISDKRYDEDSRLVCSIWMVSISITVRNILNICYRGNFYIPYIGKGLTVFQSWMIYGLLTLLNVVLFAIFLDVERTTRSEILYSFVPALISMLVYYSETYRIAVLIVFFLILTILFIAFVKYDEKYNKAVKLHKKLNKIKVKRRIFGKAYKYVACISAVVVVVFTALCMFFPKFGRRGFAASIKSTTYETDADDLMSILDEHKEELMVLNDRYFYDASLEAKLNGLQVLLNCECTYFGIETPGFKMQDMKGDMYGYYCAEEDMVYVCPENIIDRDVASEAVQTILHEGRHHYQNTMAEYLYDNEGIDINNPLYIDVKAWAENIDNYIEYDEDKDTVDVYIMYRSQPIEADSFSFGENMGLLVMSHINSW